MKLPTVELGPLEVLTIRETNGRWEGDWEVLRETPLGRHFSHVTKEQLDHVLYGFSKPFAEALGLPPEGALAKLPSPRCNKQEKCSLHDPRKCLVTSSKLPWCYEPAGLDLPEEALSMASEAVFRWREKVYLVVVREDLDSA